MSLTDVPRVLQMFVHFSITTMTGSQSGTQDPAKFAPPANMSVKNWVSTAKAMGAPVAALTAKHEAGFCIWPSKYSNYTIASSPTVGHRDLVREFVDECRVQGIKPGFYFTTGAYTPPHCNVSGTVDGGCMMDYQRNQITELATEYGEIAYWWFDHHNADPVHLMFDEVVEKHLPSAVMLGPDSWLNGEETGFASYPLYYAVNDTDGTRHSRPIPAHSPDNATNTMDGRGAFFKSWESDCSFFNGCHPWFCCGAVQDLNTTMQHWESSYGRGTNYILNVPPSPNGEIEPALVEASKSFALERERRYGDGKELGATSGTVAAGETLTLTLAKASRVDRVWLSEQALATDGQLVSAYTLEAQIAGAWEPLVLTPHPDAVCPMRAPGACGGKTIGTHHLDQLTESKQMSALRLTVVDVVAEGGKPTISMKAFLIAA